MNILNFEHRQFLFCCRKLQPRTKLSQQLFQKHITVQHRVSPKVAGVTKQPKFDLPSLVSSWDSTCSLWYLSANVQRLTDRLHARIYIWNSCIPDERNGIVFFSWEQSGSHSVRLLNGLARMAGNDGKWNYCVMNMMCMEWKMFEKYLVV
jgi:hypothetical protein